VTELANLLAAVVVLVVLPINAYVTLKLWRLHRARMDLRALRERGIVSTALTLVMAVFAVVFLNNDQAVPPLSVEQTRIATRLAMVALVFPAAYWLWLYRDH
jgi:hypothetical protein